MKKVLAMGTALVVAAVLVLLLLGTRAGVQAATQNVSVGNNFFSDATSATSTTTIVAGDTVVWTWTAGSHSVTADLVPPAITPSFDSDPPPPGFRTSPSPSYSLTFNTPGTYAYYCRIHGGPGGAAMSGTIVVQAAATSTPTSTPTSLAATDTPAPTDTPGSTNTPGSVTPTRTPTVATGTPAASATPNLDTTTVAVAPPTATATRSSASGGAAQLPRTGTGGGAPGSTPWPSLMLAVGCLVAILGAVAVGKRS